MFVAETKRMDNQGRIILPKEWRKGVEEVKVINMGDRLVIKPRKKKRLLDLGPIKADVKSPLTDWHSVKKELLGDEI